MGPDCMESFGRFGLGRSDSTGLVAYFRYTIYIQMH